MLSYARRRVHFGDCSFKFRSTVQGINDRLTAFEPYIRRERANRRTTLIIPRYARLPVLEVYSASHAHIVSTASEARELQGPLARHDVNDA
jgi:hypothetical protein